MDPQQIEQLKQALTAGAAAHATASAGAGAGSAGAAASAGSLSGANAVAGDVGKGTWFAFFRIKGDLRLWAIEPLQSGQPT